MLMRLKSVLAASIILYTAWIVKKGNVVDHFSAPLIQARDDLSQSAVGVLLVHGLNGTTRDMDELAAFLSGYGFLTQKLLLPGHGTHVRDMLAVGWEEWAAAVRTEVQALKQRCTHVFLVGHSLGGALCLHTAIHEEVTGLVTMCAPITMAPWIRLAVRLVHRWVPLVPTIREDVCDPEARRRYTRDVYRWTPMAPVQSMLQYLPSLRAELPQLTAPLLIMSATHDHVVPARDGHVLYRLAGSQQKQLVVLRRSYHVIMLDHDRAEVFAKTLAFIQHNVEMQSETLSARS